MKRYVAIFFSLLLYFFAMPVYATPDDAEGSAHFTLDATELSGDISLLVDSDRSTSLVVGGETVISINSGTPVTQLYLVWDKPPSVWDVADGGGSLQTFGRHGFLHEFVELSAPLTEFDLVFHGNGNVLCDVHLFGEGEVPAWVQKWQPPCDRADLLLFAPRAGDEFLRYGGAIPYYTNLGLDVQLAYMTRIDSSPAQNHIMLDALYSSGLRNYPVILDSPGHPDSGDDAYELYDEGEFLAFEVEQLRRFRPTVVIGPAENGDGLDGLCYDTLTVAVELALHKLEYSDSSKSYGEYSVPKLYLNGYPENEIIMDWSALSINSSGKTPMDAAKNAFKAYTWRAGIEPSESGDGDCRKFGLYKSTVGQDISLNDLFENTTIRRTVPANLPANAAASPMPVPESAPESGPAAHSQAGLRTPIPMSLIVIIALVCVIIAIFLGIKKER